MLRNRANPAVRFILSGMEMGADSPEIRSSLRPLQASCWATRAWSSLAKNLSSLPGSEPLLYTDGLIENVKKPLSMAKLLRISKKSANLYNELEQLIADDPAEDDLAYFVIDRKAA